MIRREKKQNMTILIVNKLDLKWKESETDLALSDYYDLGIEKVIGISAKNERNIGEIEDQISSFLKEWKKENLNEMDSSLRSEWQRRDTKTPIAILWKPNAGKSTLLNTLVWEQLAKVADFAGTTRDYLVWEFNYKGKDYIAYDTAGIKKIAQQHGIEKIAYDKTKAMLEYVRPIVVFMVDCTQGITHRDLTLLQEIHSLALPMIFVLNKVDLVSSKLINWMIANTQAHLDFAKYIPIIPMVAKDGSGIDETMKMVNVLSKENQKRIQTRELNQILQQEYIQRPPRFPKSKIAKILYATQIAVDAPTFVIFVNHKSRVNFSFKKWIENVIRRHFGFIGVPIVIKYKNRGEKDSRLENKDSKWKILDENWYEEEFEKYGMEEDGSEQVGLSRRRSAPLRNDDTINNKWKRKREKKSELPIPKQNSFSASSKKGAVNNKDTTRKPPKRTGKYSNTRAWKQGKIDQMFNEVYGKKWKTSTPLRKRPITKPKIWLKKTR